MQHSFTEIQMFKMLKQASRHLCKKFNLRYRSLGLFAFSDPDSRTCRGICYGDGTIYIGLRKTRRSKLDRLDTMIDTLVHELAHLKHDNHSKDFWKFHKRMKRWFYANLY